MAGLFHLRSSHQWALCRRRFGLRDSGSGIRVPGFSGFRLGTLAGTTDIRDSPHSRSGNPDLSVRLPNVGRCDTLAADAQLSFAGLDLQPGDRDAEVPLHDTTFVVVDLETTGGRAKSGPDGAFDAITEIGAVKIRGGEVLGEFATLIDPQRAIPPQIVELTGITTAMVRDAPTIEAVLPTFLEFAHGAVLVAHNAGFDIGFLKAAADRCGIPWRPAAVLCTVRLARRVLTRDEAPSVRLSSLARLVGASVEPTHRALDDARATVDVLHALIERVGNQGIETYGDLRGYLPNVTPLSAASGIWPRRSRADPAFTCSAGPAPKCCTSARLPTCAAGWASTSTARIRAAASRRWWVSRPRSTMWSAHTPRGRCARTRLLAAHAPPYNRRSPVSAQMVVGGAHRRSLSTAVRGARTRHDRAIGPFRSRADAVDAAALVAKFTGVRTCSARLGKRSVHGPSCPEREVARARHRVESPPPNTKRRPLGRRR